MPRSVILKSCPVDNSFRVRKVQGMFDMSDLSEVRREFDVNIPIEEKPWNIGLIVGSSGSGKTTIAREIFTEYLFFSGFDWKEKSMLDDFPKECSVDDIVNACGYVGLSSAPDWLKPFAVLSNGQKMRAELARLFCEYKDRPVIYDEFTSVVDRQVAQVSSYAISKFIRRKNQQFIAVSCHRDIEEWLNPDWIYDTDEMNFKWRRLRCRPEIQLDIREAEEREWTLFRPYHYLSSTHNRSARKVIAEYNGTPVAWCSWLHCPHPIKKNLKRIHRLVVRPDYQGLGIGQALLDFCAARIKATGNDVAIDTSLATFARSLSQRSNWIMTRSSITRPHGDKALRKTTAYNRKTSSFKYIGRVRG